MAPTMAMSPGFRPPSMPPFAKRRVVACCFEDELPTTPAARPQLQPQLLPGSTSHRAVAAGGATSGSQTDLSDAGG